MDCKNIPQKGGFWEKSNNLMTDSPDHSLGSVIDTQFIENIDHMTFNGMGADMKLF